jgi:hypothetical protein
MFCWKNGILAKWGERSLRDLGLETLAIVF